MTWPILLVDDEPIVLESMELLLRSANISPVIAEQDSRKAADWIRKHSFSVILLDLTMPHLPGEKLLEIIMAEQPQTPAIVVSGQSDMDTAIRCIQTGAFDYLVKPFESARLISCVLRAIELSELRTEYFSFRQRVMDNKIDHPEWFESIVSRNTAMLSIFRYIETVAPSNRPVLITGETGVGKELMARAVHEASGRKGRFVAVNAAGLDDNVFSDTLFGHIKGAFTGADRPRAGLIETAANGTLFLDEIGDLQHPSQVKLLRLLQENEYLPIGSDDPKTSSARIVAATNRDLLSLQREERFRADLYYRLQTHAIDIPPLRKRLDDLPLLVEHFLQKSADALDKPKPTVPKEVYQVLKHYNFPGNIRELESIVYEAVSSHKSRMLSLNTFHQHISKHREAPSASPQELSAESPFSLFETLPTLSEAPKLLIEEALRRTEGNKNAAAHLLGITPSGLRKALKRAENS